MDIVEDYVCDQDYRPHVPDGIYDAECIEHSRGFYGRIPKLFLKFKLVNEPYGDVELFIVFNMPYDGRIPVGSKYYKTWTKVNGRLPSRGTKMRPHLFLNKIYRVKTRTAKPKDGDAGLPEYFDYSVVDSILEVLF